LFIVIPRPIGHGPQGKASGMMLGPLILGDPETASWGDEIFTGESLQQERESLWAFTLTERVPEASV